MEIKYVVDFDPKLGEIIAETKYMEMLGFSVPELARNVALQVCLLTAHREKERKREREREKERERVFVGMRVCVCVKERERGGGGEEGVRERERERTHKCAF